MISSYGRLLAIACAVLVPAVGSKADRGGQDTGEPLAVVRSFLETHCLDCHSGALAEAGLDLEHLTFNPTQERNFDAWVLIHDRVRDGEMPPPEDEVIRPVLPRGASSDWDRDDPNDGTGEEASAEAMLYALGTSLARADRERIAGAGRAKVRRLNRHEYETTLRRVLAAPWLRIADSLPEDGVDHLFNKVGERLDVSHVQMWRYLETANRALRSAVDAAAHPSRTERFYAREEPVMQRYLHYRFGQRSATRSIVPLVGLTSEPDVIRKLKPVTVGESDPEKRELEAMGVFSGVYSATTKYDFTRIQTPIGGRYRLRFKTYSFMAGPNGASGGGDHGLTGGNRAWWRPDRNVIFASQRTEPVTLYAINPGGDSRWLNTFDSRPEPSVFECTVALQAGEGIRPDAARLVRTRPGWRGNPNATTEGVPGFAMNWLEVEGPLQEQWPPASYQSLFHDLDFTCDQENQIKAVPTDPKRDARRLLTRFHRRALRCTGDVTSVEPFIKIYDRARNLGEDFTDAVVAAAAAILCSPEFLYFETKPGPLEPNQFRQRLAYFLWNGPSPADLSIPEPRNGRRDASEAVDRLLHDRRSDRFVSSFLDYWLDLRDINANTPDAELYPDYYLDELLTESSLLETRRFFREVIDKNLPVRTLVNADFAFVNERLAQHYDLAPVEGVKLRRVELPNDSTRGGLLTQASVLRVTANGTTTSPVLRGAWIMERLLGLEIPPPPSGVAAVEPDIRGAKTIREQLKKHRSVESCNACHSQFDPAGFALESFDVAGGWRERYRSIGDEGQPVEGIGKNGHEFRFVMAQPVDCSGRLRTGESFDDIRDLKQLLTSQERQVARNLTQRLLVYATGAPVRFSDRAEVERILDAAESSEFGVKSLIYEIVNSQLFSNK